MMLAGKAGRLSGFTLIELLATLAVVVIMAAIAVPGLKNIMNDNRLAADYNEILSGLSYARSEAIKRREEIVFEVSESFPWEYRIYPSDEEGEPLRIRSGKDQRGALTGAKKVQFDSLGRTAEGSGCDSGCVLKVRHGSAGCRAISVSGFGGVGRSECTESAES